MTPSDSDNDVGPRSSEGLSIGQLAEATGVSTSSIRYYEKRGLVAAVGRVGDKRRFNPDEVDRLLFVRRAKDAGFSLDQIGVLLDPDGDGSRAVLADRLGALQQTRVELDRTIDFLERAVECGCVRIAQCPRLIEV